MAEKQGGTTQNVNLEEATAHTRSMAEKQGGTTDNARE
jgi:hypothetical protein